MNLEKGIEAMKSDPASADGASATVAAMLSQPHVPAKVRSQVFRYLALAGTAAAVATVILWPRTSVAAALSQVAAAVDSKPARYERVLKPGPDGKLFMYMEQWGEPGKYAMRFEDGMEARHSGTLSFVYWPGKSQVIDVSSVQEIDEVGVATFAKFKLRRITDEGSTIRYAFNIRQDLIVDKATNLVTKRVVYNADGSLMEIHEYFFKDDLDDRIFEPDPKPGTPLWNVPEDREKVLAMLAKRPQTQVVAGVTVKLHAVISDIHGNVGAVISGGDPRSPSPKFPMEIVGLPHGFASPPMQYTTFDGHGSQVANTLRVDGHSARLDLVYLPTKPTLPDTFTLRIPVWRRDPKLPLIDKSVNKRVGDDSRVLGYAVFRVDNVVRTSSVERVLPNYVPPAAVGVAVAGGAAKGTTKIDP